tara:strand:+ start:10576 stop:11826 length:1251 start_codon:yes stop_codon:yes gene_type:complete
MAPYSSNHHSSPKNTAIYRCSKTSAQVYQRLSRNFLCILAGVVSLLLLSFSAQAELRLNGSSIYTDLGKDQFVASLFLETAQKEAHNIETMKSEKRMELRVLNNYSMRRWVNMWMQSISINNSRETFSESAQQLIALMQAPKSAPQTGDIIEYISTPKGGTSMIFNGTELISGLSTDVFDLLLRTWIGAIPPSTSFKEELLGTQINSRVQGLVSNTQPSDARIALVASWVAPAPALAETGPTISKTKPKSDIAIAKPTTPVVVPEEQAPVHVALQAGSDASNSPADSASKIAQTGQSATAEEAPANTEDDDIADFNVSEALAQRDYTPGVVQEIYKHISYPSRAVTKKQEGTVRIAVTIDRHGELVGLVTTQESGYASLDKAALRAVEKAAPFDALPEEMKTQLFELSIPITFRLQ